MAEDIKNLGREFCVGESMSPLKPDISLRKLIVLDLAAK